MENNVVSVMLWGEEVGKLYWDERSKRAVFNYHPDFIKKGVEIAPLTASVKGSTAKGMPILGNREKIYQGLPPFLADSLPDRWGNMVFDQWAAQNHIPKRKLTPVDKLSFIGKRGMGAFEFIPATPGLESSSTLQIESLYQLARRIFEEREEISRFIRPFRMRTAKKPERMSAGMTIGTMRRFYGTVSGLKLSEKRLKS